MRKNGTREKKKSFGMREAENSRMKRRNGRRFVKRPDREEEWAAAAAADRTKKQAINRREEKKGMTGRGRGAFPQHQQPPKKKVRFPVGRQFHLQTRKKRSGISGRVGGRTVAAINLPAVISGSFCGALLNLRKRRQLIREKPDKFSGRRQQIFRAEFRKTRLRSE